MEPISLQSGSLTLHAHSQFNRPIFPQLLQVGYSLLLVRPIAKSRGRVR